jgi:hypothetical protein
MDATRDPILRPRILRGVGIGHADAGGSALQLEDVGALQVRLASAVGIGGPGRRIHRYWHGYEADDVVFGLLRVVAILALLPLATGQASGLVVFVVVVMTVADTTCVTVLNSAIMESTRRASPGSTFPSSRRSSP